jgi:hypothetical protein
VGAVCRLSTGGALVTLIASLCLAGMTPVARAVGRVSACHVPRLTGLTLRVARERVSRAGCKLRVQGARLEQPFVQTIVRQSPAARTRARVVEVWINPLCHGSAAYGPAIDEPAVTRGPTKLVSGFYLEGGPLWPFSAPDCKRPEPPPGAGTVEVADASGAVVATETSTRGHFVEIPLPAGTYTIRGTFLDATINGVHPRDTQSVVVYTGYTVRQDFFLSIP